jgi:transcriptional regulator with XRE-family HTH domain
MKRKQGATAKESIQKEVARVAQALRSAIRLSGVSSRQIERELGMSTGYLTRILTGQVELRVGVVLAVCEIVRVPAGDFFAALFPSQAAAAPPATRLARGLAQLHPGPSPGPDLDRLIQAARGLLDQMEADLRTKREKIP